MIIFRRGQVFDQNMYFIAREITGFCLKDSVNSLVQVGQSNLDTTLVEGIVFDYPASERPYPCNDLSLDIRKCKTKHLFILNKP